MKKDEFSKEETTYITNDVLQNMFNTLKSEYGKKFVEKFGFNIADSYWTGHLLCVADYFFDFYDVMYAVNSERVDESGLFCWYDYNLTLGENGLGSITLDSYTSGIRPYEESVIDELRELQSVYNKAKSSICDLLHKLRNE